MGDQVSNWSRRRPVASVAELAETMRQGGRLGMAQDGEVRIFQESEQNEMSEQVTQSREGSWGTRECSRSGNSNMDLPSVYPLAGGQKPVAETELPTCPRTTLWGSVLSWNEAKPHRLEVEKRAMRECFPGMVLSFGRDGRLSWSGHLKPNSQMNLFLVRVAYTDRFPYETPKVFVLNPKLGLSPHRYFDGSVCLLTNEGSTVFDQDGRLIRCEAWSPRWTAASLLPIVGKWLIAHENHRRHCTRDRGNPCSDNGCPDWPGPKHTENGTVN